jgi:hypothetical protein
MDGEHFDKHYMALGQKDIPTLEETMGIGIVVTHTMDIS